MVDFRRARAIVLWAIRRHFHDLGFLETDTPSLVVSPGMEPHIRPIQVLHPNPDGQVFLPTSPEFAMKRLLAQGYPAIFQICRAYRFEPRSTTHNPEFAMLEWYRADSGYEAIMDDVEALFAAIARELREGGFPLPKGVDQTKGWPRLTVEDCFSRFAGLELSKLLEVGPLREVCEKRGWIGAASPELKWDDLFFLVMLNAVEPGLASLGSPAIVYLYPESQAALSNLVIDERGLKWAKRFEVYAGGLELGNAFDELTDPVVQRRRFVSDMAVRRETYGDLYPLSPIDEEFLADLARMPKSGGIAMGVDRLVMYFTGARDIAEVTWLSSHWPEIQD